MFPRRQKITVPNQRKRNTEYSGVYETPTYPRLATLTHWRKNNLKDPQMFVHTHSLFVIFLLQICLSCAKITNFSF